MGLFDLFKRPATSGPTIPLEYVRRLGVVEAEVERLGLQWAAYRDELKRLVNRLEKREQRAEERAEREREQPRFEADPGPEMDEVSRRVHARRNARLGNGLSE